MKLLIVYRGFYKRLDSNVKTFSGGELKDINGIKSVKENIKYFQELLNPETCDIIFHTYKIDNANDEKLLEVASPKSYIFEEYGGKRMTYSAIQANELVSDCVKKYDIIINLRFGLKFMKKLNIDNIYLNKFNFLWQEPIGYRVCDFIFIYPSNLHIFFENAVHFSKRPWSMHTINQELENIARDLQIDIPLNVIIKGRISSHCIDNNDYVRLCY
tara:strand:+ start:2951 stop:3595 length:645 start_codon:yes stop_codon:yes gene_type:complete